MNMKMIIEKIQKILCYYHQINYKLKVKVIKQWENFYFSKEIYLKHNNNKNHHQWIQLLNI